MLPEHEEEHCHRISHVDKPTSSDCAAYVDESWHLALKLGQQLQSMGALITTAESCTGGLVAAALTEIPGSSAWFEQGAVTYSNAVKHALLAVPAAVFEQSGAVSEACVRAMAAGAKRASGADVAVAVSGIAGPDGGTVDKPVGTVWIAWAIGNDVFAECFLFSGDRRRVRYQAVICALRGTISHIEKTRSRPS